jgi:hypothetical protein
MTPHLPEELSTKIDWSPFVIMGNPTVFRIERRMSVPYEINRYFSIANLKSTDHIEALEDFEKFALRAST